MRKIACKLLMIMSVLVSACDSGGHDSKVLADEQRTEITAPIPDAILLALRSPAQPTLALKVVVDRATAPPGTLINVAITHLDLDTGTVTGA